MHPIREMSGEQVKAAAARPAARAVQAVVQDLSPEGVDGSSGKALRPSLQKGCPIWPLCTSPCLTDDGDEGTGITGLSEDAVSTGSASRGCFPVRRRGEHEDGRVASICPTVLRVDNDLRKFAPLA